MRGVIRGKSDNRKYFIDGKEVTQEEFSTAFPPVIESGNGVLGSSLTGWTPIASESTAYHPSQRKAAEEYLKSKGVPTEIDPQGRPIFRTREHRRKFMKVNNQHDNDGGYGDG